jgi:hypothetical protein
MNYSSNTILKCYSQDRLDTDIIDSIEPDLLTGAHVCDSYHRLYSDQSTYLTMKRIETKDLGRTTQRCISLAGDH